MTSTPREVAERVARMVSGEALTFADMFAVDGVLTYPFAAPGTPPELRGREAIRAQFAALADGSAALFDMAGISSGNPPEDQTPRLTSSTRCLKCVWQGLMSLQVLMMPMTGLPL